MDYKRIKSTELITMLDSKPEHEKEQIWAILSRRSHADSITGAITNNGPKERRK